MVLFNRKTYTRNVMNVHKSTPPLRFIYVIKLSHGSRIGKLRNFLRSKLIKYNVSNPYTFALLLCILHKPPQGTAFDHTIHVIRTNAFD